MYTKIQVVFDAAELAKLAEFWALDYVFEPHRLKRIKAPPYALVW